MSKIIYTEQDFEKFQVMIEKAKDIGEIYWGLDPSFKRGSLDSTTIDCIDSINCVITNTEYASGCGYETTQYVFSSELFNKNIEECREIITKQVLKRKQEIEDQKQEKIKQESIQKEEIAKAKRAKLISSLTPEEIDEITSNLQQK